MLAEYQDSIETFLRLGVKKNVKWVVERGFVLKVFSEEAYEEPCLSLLRSFAFVPFLWNFFASRALQGWWRVGEDLYYSVFKESLMAREMLEAMGESASVLLFSTSLGAFLGSSLLAYPVPSRLSEKFEEFMKEGDCSLGLDEGVSVYREDKVLEFSFPLSSTLSFVSSLFGLGFAFLASEFSSFPKDPIKILLLSKEMFVAFEKYLRRERGLYAGECWYEVREGVKGNCGLEFEVEEPFPPWGWEAVKLKPRDQYRGSSGTQPSLRLSTSDSVRGA